MWSHKGSIDEELILELNVFCCHSKALNADPLANSVLPANNAPFDEIITVDLCPFHDGCVVDLAARTDYTVSTNDNVGAKTGGRVNLGRGINKYVFSDGISGGEPFGHAGSHRLKEKLLPNKVVLWLADVHPVTIKSEDIEVVVCGHFRENLPLNRSGLQFDAIDH